MSFRVGVGRRLVFEAGVHLCSSQLSAKLLLPLETAHVLLCVLHFRGACGACSVCGNWRMLNPGFEQDHFHIVQVKFVFQQASQVKTTCAFKRRLLQQYDSQEPYEGSRFSDFAAPWPVPCMKKGDRGRCLTHN